MTKFNPNVLNDPLGGWASSYGVPSCIIGLGKDVLNLLPGDILGSIQKGIWQGRRNALGHLSDLKKNIFDDIGIIQFNTETGVFYFQSEGAGSDSALGDSLESFGEFLGEVAGQGAAYWKNYEVLSETVSVIENCLGDFSEWLQRGENKADVNSTSELAASLGRFNAYKEQAKTAEDFIEVVDEQARAISEVLRARAADPGLVPEFEDPDSAEEVASDPIFRLTFGPPKSKKGQFLLSVDGLYYDSQGEDGVPTQSDIGFIPLADRWELDHAPSLGGRGKGYTIADLSRYVDTIFDLDIIDNSDNLEDYYEADHLLQVLISNKNVRVEDLNDNLSDLLGEGYTTNSALYINLLQQLNSEIAAFDQKIHKRKKQIEVAVKAPDLFGASDKFVPGKIPVNDFSYLSGINLGVELEKQKNLVFDHGEVSGIVLPVQPLFVKAEGSQQGVVITPLLGSEVGAGSMLDGEELEGDAPVLSLTTGISTDGLVCVYNFTDGNLVSPGSTEFKTLNCNANGTEYRGQLVSRYPTTIYTNGLGVPYLNGIVSVAKEDIYGTLGGTWGDTPFEVVDSNNYLKLPDDIPFQDLMYSPSGCTVDVWTKIPGITQERTGWWEHPYDTSAFDFRLSSTDGKWLNGHYYRVLMGCENTGGVDNDIDASALIADRSSDFVRGMLMGFSRDPKMYYQEGVVTAGSTDLDIRENFGWPVSGMSRVVQATPIFDASALGEDFTWVLSSDINGNLVDAAALPSGTSQVNSTSDANTASISVTFAGDKLPLSAHGTDYKLDITPKSILLVENVGPSGTPYFSHVDDPVENPMYAVSSCFFIAPTQSYNSSAVGFVKAGSCDTESEQLLRFTASLNKTVSGVTLSSIASEYMHLAIVFEPLTDAIKLYVDGILYEEGLISTTFNVSPGQMPQVPSLLTPSGYSTSSFYYSENTVSAGGAALTDKVFNDGPTHNGFFTPWIVGGGWTDGRSINLDTSSGGFMSPGDGLISSYNGNIGSFKVYCRALNTSEVKVNFDSQKTFFKNIQ
jgi:hypothetical protein